MPVLLKDGQPVADSWIVVGDDEATVPDGPVLISLERWRRDRAALTARNAPLGVRLASHHLAPEIAADVTRFDLVVLDFPKFRDGRAFSTARALREHHGYTGEIRAVGHVLPDQLQFLIRTGFTSVEVADGVALGPWQTALREMTIAYQPGLGDGGPLAGLKRRIAAG
jgi:uncharacterized protein (DUF934 family)